MNKVRGTQTRKLNQVKKHEIKAPPPVTMSKNPITSKDLSALVEQLTNMSRDKDRLRIVTAAAEVLILIYFFPCSPLTLIIHAVALVHLRTILNYNSPPPLSFASKISFVFIKRIKLGSLLKRSILGKPRL